MDHAGLTIVHLPLPPTRIVSPKDFPRASEAAPQGRKEKRQQSDRRHGLETQVLGPSGEEQWPFCTK